MNHSFILLITNTLHIMNTELIGTTKSGLNVGGRDMVIIVTVTGKQIWANKANFDANAEVVSYNPMKAGDPYTKKDGSIGNLKADRNEYVGCGKQTVKKFNSIELIDYMIAKGVTPQFAM